MAKLIKLRYLVLAMLAVAVIVSATVFSVSYAKWTGGVNTLSLSASTGEWWLTTGLGALSDDEIDTQIRNELKPILWGQDYGGVIIDGANGETKALKWRNSGGMDGCYFEMKLTKGDTFVAEIFGRVWELNKLINSDKGMCLFADSVGYAPSSTADIRLIANNKGEYKVFTVLKDCNITLDIREGDHTGEGSDKDDILTITGASVNYPQ